MVAFALLLTGPLTRVALPDGMSREIPEKIIALDRYLHSIQPVSD